MGYNCKKRRGKRMKSKIAQIGTFDVENFGDLLFANILEKYFAEYDIDLFSPRGKCEKPFEKDKYVYSIDDLEDQCREKEYQALIIGGGDIIRSDVQATSVYDERKSISFELWAKTILIGNKYDIPILFNAPGVPFDFDENMQKVAGELLESCRYLSVRDSNSAKYLNQCTSKVINVVPDTVLTINNLYSKIDMKIYREQLREKFGLPLDENYIVVQHNCCNIDDEYYIEQLKKVVCHINGKGLKVVLLPIGYVHKDILFLEKLYSADETNQILVKEKLTPVEIVAILAGSAGYVGTSMHGAVISYAYEKFAICINTSNYSKITGLLKNLDHSEWEAKNITDVEKMFDDIYNKPVKYDLAIKTEIINHFNRMKEIILKGKTHVNIPNILEEYYNILSKVENRMPEDFIEAIVYFDYGNGFFADEAVHVKYKKEVTPNLLDFSLEVPTGTKKIRIDPIESALIRVDALKIQIGEDYFEANIDNCLMVEDCKLIISTDPCFIVSVNINAREKLKVHLQAQILTLSDIQNLLGKFNYQKEIERLAYKEELYKRDQNEKRIINECDELREEKQQLKEKLLQIETKNVQLETENIQLREKSNQSEVQYKKIETESRIQIDALNSMNLDLRNRLSEKENENEIIKNSLCWKITAPIRVTGNVLYRLMMKTYVTQCALEAMKILVQKGPTEVFRACRRFIDRSLHSQEANEMLPNRSSNNKDGYLPYECEYQDNIKFEGTPDVKMLAFYLPQYHTFPENDEWWGKGFTEWVNVKNGDSRFEGHYQPRVPHKDIGYYNLEDISVLKRQAELAKEHGIYGFCFYYYWFSGKRLMEKPVDMLLEHPEIDLPFCLCWANENWTRAWDGQNKNVLIAQDYSDEDDERFMVDLEKYISDKRYIRINGKPLVIVYNPGQIPDCHKSFAKWRECAKRIGIGDILIWTCQTANNSADILNIGDCIDGEVEFPPHNMWLESIAVRDLDLHGKSAFIYNYQCLVDYQIKKLKENTKTTVPVHHGCMLAWDNAARRKDAWFTYYAFSLKSLYKWVNALVDNARKNYDSEERFVFINAWNEWGEGTYLEPDEKYGYANINTVSKALYDRPFRDDIIFINEKSSKLEKMKENSSIAVQVHMFYLETLDETIENLNYIPYKYDCYISTDSEEKKKIIESAFKLKSTCNKCQVDVFENRGRDVAPFIVQMSSIISNYKYICHIHSKKTKTGEYGNEWRKYIFRHLFGSKEYLEALFAEFEDNDKLGIIMPETFPVLELQAEWGGNLEGVKNLLERLECRTEELPADPVFPVGNMFWAKVEAILPMFTHGLKQTDFPEEQGQTNATIAHQIERSWVYVAAHGGYTYRKLFNNCKENIKLSQKKRIGIFVHYDKEDIISEEDITSVSVYSKIMDDLVFVTNSMLEQEELEKVKPYVSRCICRENKGLDFGAWKEAILLLGRKKIMEYDELVLCNNSCFAPIFPLEKMFIEMEQEDVDFWGNCIFPYSLDGSYIHKDCIPEHLQSYFTVYNKNLLKSDTFWEFWEDIPVYENYIDVVGNCESQFTKILADAGFTYSPYIKESYYLCQYLQNYSVPYEKPTSLLLLNSPFVKKKCYEYMNCEEKNKLETYIENLK